MKALSRTRTRAAAGHKFCCLPRWFRTHTGHLRSAAFAVENCLTLVLRTRRFLVATIGFGWTRCIRDTSTSLPRLASTRICVPGRFAPSFSANFSCPHTLLRSSRQVRNTHGTRSARLDSLKEESLKSVWSHSICPCRRRHSIAGIRASLPAEITWQDRSNASLNPEELAVVLVLISALSVSSSMCPFFHQCSCWLVGRMWTRQRGIA